MQELECKIAKDAVVENFCPVDLNRYWQLDRVCASLPIVPKSETVTDGVNHATS